MPTTSTGVVHQGGQKSTISDELQQLLRKNIQEFENNQKHKNSNLSNALIDNTSSVNSGSLVSATHHSVGSKVLIPNPAVKNHLPLKYIDDFDSDEEEDDD